MLTLIITFYETSGKLYYGFFTGKDTLYNSDAFISLMLDFQLKKNLSFYVKYSSLLEMAEQIGKVFLDPMFATYSIIFGLKFKKIIWLDFYIDHYCRHYIDRELDGGKVVFNAEFYSIRNYKKEVEKFDNIYSYNLTYAFYPNAIIVDWLNSRPYYRHRFIFNGTYKIYNNFYLETTFEYTISREEYNYPKQVFYKIIPEIGAFYKNNKGFFCLYIDYFFKIKDPLRMPENLMFIGLSFCF